MFNKTSILILIILISALGFNEMVSADADTSTLGGSVINAGIKSVICRNITTGQSITMTRLNGATSWDCTAAGLKTKVGDSIKQILIGTIPEQFSGMLEAKNWSKTKESYCHGGSEYYVLVTNNVRYLLNSQRDRGYAEEQTHQAQLLALAGQPVTISGELIKRTFSEAEHCLNTTTQCLSGPITCTWIRIFGVTLSE